jgi:hypothetical protein
MYLGFGQALSSLTVGTISRTPLLTKPAGKIISGLITNFYLHANIFLRVFG